jgi:protein SCO1
MTTTRSLLAGFFILLGIAGAAWFFAKAVQPAVLSRATVLPESRPLPQFELLDSDGAAFTNDTMRGNWQLLFFGFTHCPDICPATLQQLSLARQRLAENGSEPLPQIKLVSADPERDTPAVLRDYTRRFGAGVSGVTGALPALRNFAAVFGVHFEKTAEVDGNYSINHSAAVLLINPDVEFHAVFSAPHDIDSFVNDLQILLNP